MTGDNRLISAQAKDKIQATQEFETAVGEGKAAALQEQVSGDSELFNRPNWKTGRLIGEPVFRISLGSIPAWGTISTKTVVRMRISIPWLIVSEFPSSS